MKQKLIKSIISCSIAFSLSVGLMAPGFAATTLTPMEPTPIIPIEDQQTLEQLTLGMCEIEDVSLTTEATKVITDFAGNIYYVTEYSPSGYMITQAESGIAVEYSTTASSPYLGYTDNLFYAGPTGYYYFNGTEYVHTAINETLSAEVAASLSEGSSTLHTRLSDAPESENTLMQVANGSLQVENISGEIISTTASTTYPDTYYFFQTLNTEAKMGYYSVDGGLCGYVAAGMLLLWADYKMGYDNLIDDFIYLNSAGTGFNGSAFTRRLRFDFGSASGSTASSFDIMMASIKGVIMDYGDSVGVPITTVVRTLPSLNTIINDMKTYSPALVFGSVMNVSSYDTFFNHAVVAYGYASDSSYITVHYGWPPYTNSNTNVTTHYNNIKLVYQAIGQSLCITSFGSSPITFTDISSSNWAYEAAAYCKKYGVIDNGSTYFLPDDEMTRGCFINALYVLAGFPRVQDTNDPEMAEIRATASSMYSTFSDFSSSSTYHNAAAWAHHYGILEGSSSTTLGLGATLTRQQAATFLYRYATVFNHTLSSSTDLQASDFPDYSNVATWAKDAVDWAVENGLINGSDGCLLPETTLIRSHAAQMCYKYANIATK